MSQEQHSSKSQSGGGRRSLSDLGKVRSLRFAGDFSANRDFSKTSNPSGPWSYGFSSALGASPTLFTTGVKFDGAELYWWWMGGRDNAFPCVAFNDADQWLSIKVGEGTVVFRPGSIAMHPGPAGEVSVVRFTVPAPGEYMIGCNYMGIDTTPTTADVHVLVNGRSIFSDYVHGYKDLATFTTTGAVSLAQGSVVDWIVGGSNDGPNNDFVNVVSAFIFATAE